MKHITLILFITITHSHFSQNLNVYTDDRGYFFGFFDKQKINIEYQPVASYKVGYKGIGYVDSRGSLIYFSDKKEKLEIGTFASHYQTTDYLFGYQRNQSLGTIENLQKKTLTQNVGAYHITDSLIAFNDNIKKGFYVYYNNEIIELENNIIENEVTNFKATENTLAYFNAQGYFKIFNANNILEIDRPSTLYNYEVGKDIVAYIDIDNESLNVIENGNIQLVEESLPLSFKCGDNFMAYITNQDEFRMYKGGQVQEICAYAPANYLTIDDLVIYENLGRFTVFVNGQNYELENYWVQNFQADGQALAYIDNQGWLIYVFDGKKEKITNQKITSFSLVGNTLQYSLEINQFMLFENKRNIQ